MRREGVVRLDELWIAVLGKTPDNPVQALSELDEDELVRLLRERGGSAFDAGEAEEPPMYSCFPAATEIGILVGENLPPEEWLAWFEDAGPRSGAAGRVSTEMLNMALKAQKISLQVRRRKIASLRDDPALAQRVLAIIDSYLAEWRGQDLGGEATTLCMALEDICPIEGGLKLIRKWLVETPFGDEIVEMSLCECLRLWPLEEARQTVLDVLATSRGGAVKGSVRCWKAAKGDRESAWTTAEAQEFLEAPLAEAVGKTDSSPAVLYADIFAGRDLLKPRAREIADALLERRDDAYCSALGFDFLERVDLHAAQTVWLQWFHGDDEYRLLAACNAAAGLPEIAKDPSALARFQDLALDTTQASRVRAEAAMALYQLERDFDRCLRILGAWLDQAKLSAGILVATGRLVLWGPIDKARTFLRERALDPARQPAEVRHEMLLLATVDADVALDLCEAGEHRERFDDYTRLLVAATAEAMDADHGLRAAELRASCEEAEPAWMKNLRLRITGENDRAEAEVASYAWSRPD